MKRFFDGRPALAAGIFWGAIWGMYEATAGYLVHGFVRIPGASSMLLVPFGVFCMIGAVNVARDRRAAMIAAATAAGLKLIDFALPHPTLLHVVNPAVAILLEGGVFVVAARWLLLPERRPTPSRAVVAVLSFSAMWRLGFLAYSQILAVGWSTGMLRDGLHTVPGFLLRDGLLSAAAVMLMVVVIHRRGRSPLSDDPLPGPAGISTAVVVAASARVIVGLLG